MDETTPTPPSDKTYTTSAGNRCRCRFEIKGERIGVAAWWNDKPSDADLREVMDWIARDTGVDALIHAQAGAGVAGRARQTDQVRRFLETDDPGVETQTREVPQ